MPGLSSIVGGLVRKVKSAGALSVDNVFGTINVDGIETQIRNSDLREFNFDDKVKPLESSSSDETEGPAVSKRDLLSAALEILGVRPDDLIAVETLAELEVMAITLGTQISQASVRLLSLFH